MGFSVRGGCLSKGSPLRGVSVQRVSVGGISVQGVSVWGLCPGRSLSRGGLCPGWGGSLSGRSPPPLYSYVWAVRFLLKCILVLKIIFRYIWKILLAELTQK